MTNRNMIIEGLFDAKHGRIEERANINLNKVYKTKSGIEFKILQLTKDDIKKRFKDYDATVALCHLHNTGVVFIDPEYELPIDNEYDLEEIESTYKHLIK